MFVGWLEYWEVAQVVTVAVPPQFTSQDCSGCGERVKEIQLLGHQCSKVWT